VTYLENGSHYVTSSRKNGVEWIAHFLVWSHIFPNSQRSADSEHSEPDESLDSSLNYDTLDNGSGIPWVRYRMSAVTTNTQVSAQQVIRLIRDIVCNAKKGQLN
jgi:hypothetical protein